MRLPAIRCEPIVYASALNVVMLLVLQFALKWPSEGIVSAEVLFQAVFAPWTRSRVVPTAIAGPTGSN